MESTRSLFVLVYSLMLFVSRCLALLRFASDLLNAIQTVNATQMQSAQTKANFEANGDVSVTDVLINSQRASVAFEATLQVRNKVLKAYQDVMSMPV